MKKKYEKPQLVSEKMELNLLCHTCQLPNNLESVAKFNVLQGCISSTCLKESPNISPHT
jgi:hypothetical protein